MKQPKTTATHNTTWYVMNTSISRYATVTERAYQLEERKRSSHVFWRGPRLDCSSRRRLTRTRRYIVTHSRAKPSMAMATNVSAYSISVVTFQLSNNTQTLSETANTERMTQAISSSIQTLGLGQSGMDIPIIQLVHMGLKPQKSGRGQCGIAIPSIQPLHGQPPTESVEFTAT